MESTAIYLQVVFNSTDCCLTCSHPNHTSKSVSFCSKINVTNMNEKYFLTNQNSIAEEIKSRLKSGNVCYRSVQNLLSSRLLSKNLKIKICRTIILPIFLYDCET